MADRPWKELLELYPEGHPVRSAIKWADMNTVPVLAGVLVEEVERLTMALGAHATEIEMEWIEENQTLKLALSEVWNEYEELMPDALRRQVKEALGLVEFEGKLDG